MNKVLSFDDVLLTPQFSTVKSRKDVDTSVRFLGEIFTKAIISSNMDTVTESTMANAMGLEGALGCLHRFMDIDRNVEEFGLSNHPGYSTMVSFGLGLQELSRVAALSEAGASMFVLDVAHGASLEVVKQVKSFRELVSSDTKLVVGNFATGQSIKDFQSHLGNKFDVDAYKIGIGPGSFCTTRVATGSGWPSLSSLLDCRSANAPLIMDGGITNSGDYSKALAAGATMVMIGRLLAGTNESPGNVIWTKEDDYEGRPAFKKYRGSASLESYHIQGKVSEWRTSEGASGLVPYVGPVKNVLQDLDAGLRSAMSYTGAHTIEEFQEKAQFVEVTTAGHRENDAHGKRN